VASPGEKARPLVQAELRGATVIDEIAGNNRYIAVTEDMVFVGSTGAASGAMFGGAKVKRYPIDSITAVDVQKGMMLVTLEIVMSGAKESKTNAGFMDVANNENITAFPKKEYPRVQELAALILDLRGKLKKPNAVAAAPSAMTIPEQIRQLAELKEAGILTEAEFVAKKTELLARM